ncbi:hypothetical protein DSO57_1031153 [Entomophthora muscae]|uniref:Uncharacterized protein n=1 Tax=Entomophthora muscae TaxID=34485 RepID=A0ACC2TBH9_9FUNG|nr:hypothetical protein DSO57_1031153 [Entomophthora muscae]
MSSSDIVTYTLSNINYPQQSKINIYHQLIRLTTNKVIDDFIPVKNPETAKDIIIDDQVKYSNDESLFLLHEDTNQIEERIIIYAPKSHLNVLKDKEDRVMPLIYCLMIGTKQENYVYALKIIKKKIQKIVLEEQETKPTSAGKPHKDPVASIRLTNTNLVLLDFEADQSLAFKEVFECATQGANVRILHPSGGYVGLSF